MASEEAVVNRLKDINKVVLVLSGKGGVGKSSVSVQLALGLAAENPGAKIGILDIDLTGPSLPRMLGLEGQPVHMTGEGWTPVPVSENVSCMSLGFLLKSNRDSVVWRGPKKTAMIRQFLSLVNWGRLDYLVVDTPPGTSDEHISLLEGLRPILVGNYAQLSNTTLAAVLVSTPQAMALIDVSKELDFVRKTELPLIGLIENMSGYICPHCGDTINMFGRGGAEDLCAREEEIKERAGDTAPYAGCKFLGRLPLDPEVARLLDGSAPAATLVGGYRQSHVYASMRDIVHKVVAYGK